jgi:hypothetical protein
MIGFVVAVVLVPAVKSQEALWTSKPEFFAHAITDAVEL